MSAGPLTSLHFLDRISSAVHSFLTPGQVLETVRDAARTLKDAYELFLAQESKLTADRGDGPRKKRKKDKDAPSSQGCAEPEYYAVSFALIARTTVVVLRSLPLHTLNEDARLEAQRAVGEVHSAIATRTLTDGLLHPDRMHSWHWQMAVAGALRLHYGLVRAPGQEQQLLLEKSVSSAMLSLVATPGVSPELLVEMVVDYMFGAIRALMFAAVPHLVAPMQLRNSQALQSARQTLSTRGDPSALPGRRLVRKSAYVKLGRRGSPRIAPSVGRPVAAGL